jgi:hypothetical protein
MKNVIRSVLAMGFLGTILVLMALAVFAGSFTATSNLDSLIMTWERISALSTVEDQVSVSLRDMQLSELYFVYGLDYEMGVDDELDTAAALAGDIDLLFDNLIAEGHFTEDLEYEPEAIELLDEFRALLDQHRRSLDELLLTYEAGETGAVVDGVLDIQEDNEALQWMLTELISELDADRLWAAWAFPESAASALLGAGAALIAMLLLALIGYQAIARLTRPVVDLANAVTAIGGDRYRPELLGGLLKSSGSAGRFARALDSFARDLEQRDASLKAEIDELRAQLYESRRRRLKISAPNR